MSLPAKLRSFLRNLFSSHRVDADLDHEVHSHLSMLIDESIRAGMSPDEAQRAARTELGGIERVEEQVRDRRMGNWLHSVLSDCRCGVRQLRKNPGFAAVAILTLALGIGANTAIFSVVDAVLLRPLPFQDPSRLVMFHEGVPKMGFSPPDLAVFEREQKSSSAIGAFQNKHVNISGRGEPERVAAARVSSSLFPLLGMQPILGRIFATDEDSPGHNVVLLSYGPLQRRYGRLPAFSVRPSTSTASPTHRCHAAELRISSARNGRTMLLLRISGAHGLHPCGIAGLGRLVLH